MITYSMSSVGKCSRTLSAERLGLLSKGGEAPEYLRLAAREGGRHEKYIREDLPEHGYTSLGAGGKLCQSCGRVGIHVELRVTTPTGKEVIFIGHLDDYCMDMNSPGVMIAEYKALGRFMCDVLRDGVKDHRTYATQVSLYHHAHTVTPYVILYIIKNRDTGRIKVWVYPEALVTLQSIVVRVDIIEEYVARNEMAPCDAEKESADKYSCTGLCDTGISETLPIPGSVDIQVGNFRTALVLEEQAKQLRTEARGVFAAYLQGSGRKSIKVDDMTISLVGLGTRKVYDVPEEVKQAFVREVERPAYIRVLDRKETE